MRRYRSSDPHFPEFSVFLYSANEVGVSHTVTRTTGKPVVYIALAMNHEGR